MMQWKFQFLIAIDNLVLQYLAKWWQYNIPRLNSSSLESDSSNQYVHIIRTFDKWGRCTAWRSASDFLLSAEGHNHCHTYFEVS